MLGNVVLVKPLQMVVFRILSWTIKLCFISILVFFATNLNLEVLDSSKEKSF